MLCDVTPLYQLQVLTYAPLSSLLSLSSGFIWCVLSLTGLP